MWKYVLPLVFAVSVSAVFAQTTSASSGVNQIQKRAAMPANGMQQAAIRESQVAAIVDDPRQSLEHLQVANIVTERQVAMRRDTEKLLSLAAELKQNMDRTGPNILSMDVIKKAQEIEKLAKSVKEKMKEAF
jgi:hypothetical protein